MSHPQPDRTYSTPVIVGRAATWPPQSAHYHVNGGRKYMSSEGCGGGVGEGPNLGGIDTMTDQRAAILAEPGLWGWKESPGSDRSDRRGSRPWSKPKQGKQGRSGHVTMATIYLTASRPSPLVSLGLARLATATTARAARPPVRNNNNPAR